jgi:hypothetical protein
LWLHQNGSDSSAFYLKLNGFSRKTFGRALSGGARAEAGEEPSQTGPKLIKVKSIN